MSGVSAYTQEVGDMICERLAVGESLRSICGDENTPALSTVFKWLNDFPAFSEQYARAREEQAEALFDEIVSIADEECTMVRANKHPSVKSDDENGDIEVVFDSTAVARNRLRVEARKWAASKLKPKKYGDKLDLNHSGEVSIASTLQLARERAAKRD
mgnify:CR=1 FL=1